MIYYPWGGNMSDYLYTIGDTTAMSPTNSNFCLHTHSAYEIFFFLEGDAKYVVEEKQYDLAPGDIIIIRKNEFFITVIKNTAESLLW